MTNWIDIEKNSHHISREKLKARELRKTQWWKNKVNKGICHYCQNKFSPEQLTMDHIVPLSRGGKSTKGNIVPCCKSCNNEKRYLTPVDMLFNKLKKEEKEYKP